MNNRTVFNAFCTIQNGRKNSDGMVDTVVFVSQTTKTRCRVIKQISRRKTSPDSTEKVQYGTFVFGSFMLPRNAVIAPHDRILFQGIVYDVADVLPPQERSRVRYLVAVCDTRA